MHKALCLQMCLWFQFISRVCLVGRFELKKKARRVCVGGLAAWPKHTAFFMPRRHGNSTLWTETRGPKGTDYNLAFFFFYLYKWFYSFNATVRRNLFQR
jgi:hypothetical protein